jgi:hypothetical protein
MIFDFKPWAKAISIAGAGVLSIFLIGRVLDRARYDGLIENPYNFDPIKTPPEPSSLGELSPPQAVANASGLPKGHQKLVR